MEFKFVNHGIQDQISRVWFEISWVGLKSHGLVWNLTGWFEISQGSFEISRGSFEISQVFIFNQKKWELPGVRAQAAFNSPHSIWLSNLPLGLERPSLIWMSISIVALCPAHFCWNLCLLSPNTTHADRGSRSKGKFDIQIKQGPSTLKAVLIFSLQIWKLLVWYINLIKRFRSDALCDFYKINLGTSA